MIKSQSIEWMIGDEIHEQTENWCELPQALLTSCEMERSEEEWWRIWWVIQKWWTFLYTFQSTYVPRIVLPQKPWIFNKLFDFFSKYKNYFLTLFLAFSLCHHLRLNNIINPLFYLYEHKKYVFWTVLCNYVQALPACLLASAKCHNIT